MTGGPIARDRTFFMVSYEGLRQNGFRELLTTVPTALERSGDFSQTRGANGQPITIYDPATTAPNRGRERIHARAVFSQPHPARAHGPRGVERPALLPRTQPARRPDDGAEQFLRQRVGESEHRQLRSSESITCSARNGVSSAGTPIADSLDAPPQLFPGETGDAEGRINLNDWGQNFVLDYSDLTWGENGPQRAPGLRAQPLPVREPGTRLFTDQSRFPSRHRGERRSAHVPRVRRERRHVARRRRPSFERVQQLQRGGEPEPSRSAPTFLKAGYEGRMLRINVWEARAAGSYTFSRLFTQGPNPLATTALGGHGFASFLLGTGSSGLLYQNWKNVAAQSFYHACYLQDDWRVTNRLTVNAGLRYDFDMPRTERYDRMSWFDPDAALTSGRCGPGIPGSARRSAIRRRRRQSALAVPRRLEQSRASCGRRVSADAEDGVPRRGRAVLRAEHAGRAGDGRTVRVPSRDAVGRDARQPDARQPAPESVSAGVPSRARRDRRTADRDRRPRRSPAAPTRQRRTSGSGT